MLSYLPMECPYSLFELCILYTLRHKPLYKPSNLATKLITWKRRYFLFNYSMFLELLIMYEKFQLSSEDIPSHSYIFTCIYQPELLRCPSAQETVTLITS